MIIQHSEKIRSIQGVLSNQTLGYRYNWLLVDDDPIRKLFSGLQVGQNFTAYYGALQYGEVICDYKHMILAAEVVRNGRCKSMTESAVLADLLPLRNNGLTPNWCHMGLEAIGYKLYVLLIMDEL